VADLFPVGGGGWRPVRWRRRWHQAAAPAALFGLEVGERGE
jgi:hypothetical protein